MRIGWTNRGYPVTRTILNKVPGVEYVRSRSYGALLSRFCGLMHLPERGRLKLGCTYIGGTADCRVDLMHFFNLLGCGLCDRPYVTTFETSVPRAVGRDDYWFKCGLESLQSNQCRRLLALSECAKQIQIDSLRAFLNPSEVDAIESKIEVLHPPQDIHLSGAQRPLNKNLTALFVGKDFFRKGGSETLRALLRVRKHYPVELWLIGDPSRFDYACDAALDNTMVCQRLIEENKDWIHWRPFLSNAKVLELMKSCDVGLLPTRADTYGYSVLEMQACGLPVVTTDVRALPEINSNDCGWIIRGCGIRDGIGQYGEADCSTLEKLRALSERIEEGVYVSVMQAVGDRDAIMRKGDAAINRIRREHNPCDYGVRLRKIYETNIDG